MVSNSLSSRADTEAKEVFGYPKGLLLLTSVEAWERFSFYSMQALLPLFLTAVLIDEGFGWSNGDAIRLVGIYGAFVYLTPAIGGWIADKYIGPGLAVRVGAVLMMLGHFAMAGPALFPIAIEGILGFPVKQVILDAGIPLGSARISAEMSDALRTAVDALAGVSGQTDARLAAAKLGYYLSSWSFYSALILIGIGNGFFKPSTAAMAGRLYSTIDGGRDSAFTIFYMGTNIGSFAAALISGVLGEKLGWHYGFTAAGFGMILAMSLYVAFRKKWLGSIEFRPPKTASHTPSLQRLDASEIRRIKALFIMAMFSVAFFVAFSQMYGLLNIFLFQGVDRVVFGFEIPSLWIWSLNPLAIIVFSPFICQLWVRMERANRNPSAVAKFGVGFVLISLAFAIIGIAATMAGTEKIHIFFPIVSLIILTVGEIMVGPIGFSLVSVLVPERYATRGMGAWFLVFALASWLAGEVGALSDTIGTNAVFLGVSLSCMLLAFLLFILRSYVSHLMRDETKESFAAS